MFAIHKTAINATQGYKSSSIHPTNLIGNFVPSQGINSTHWDNQEVENALRRFNGIAHSSTSHPYYYQFDGTNDYLGEASSSYGGDAFYVVFQNAYTISQWVHLPSTWTTGNKHVMIQLFNTDANQLYAYIDGATMKARSFTSDGNQGPFSIGSVVNLINNRDKWLYHTISHDGSGLYKYYINGTFIDSTDANYAPTAQNTNTPLTVGFSPGGGDGAFFTSANVRIGHMHVHSSELGSSQIRQNYLASQDVNNTRYFGDTSFP